MPYVDYAQISSRITARKLVQLLDDEKLALVTDDLDAAIDHNPLIAVRLDDSIDAAQGAVDGFLRARRVVPLPEQYPNICRLAQDLTIYYLATRRVFDYPGIPGVELLKDDAMKMLGKIAEARHDVGVEPEPPASSKAFAQTSSNPAKFTSTSLKDF